MRDPAIVNDLMSPDIINRIRKKGIEREGRYTGFEVPEVSGRDNTDVPYLGNALYIGNTFQGFSVLVGTTPTLIFSAPVATPLLILNPSLAIGLTNTVAGVPLTTTGVVGNSQASSIGVANYNEAHIIVNIYANAGTWSFYQQVFDPINSAWVDAQTLVNAAVGTGSFYNFVGSFGVATDMAFRWDFAAAGNITFDIVVILKGGLGGTGTGLVQTVYIGNADVTTTFGYPILEGQEKQVVLGENVDLYGIANAPLDIRVFKLR